MKKLLILGAGTAGTMVANRMRRLLDTDSWEITIVDQHETHYYQPGFLFIPFGIYSKNEVVKPKRDFIPAGVELIMSPIESVEPAHNRVKLVKDGRILNYDFLVIATGAHIHPEQTPGLQEHEWRNSIHEFYTLEGALALAGLCIQNLPGLFHGSGGLALIDMQPSRSQTFQLGMIGSPLDHSLSPRIHQAAMRGGPP